MIRRLYNKMVSAQASRRRIRFNQLRQTLCPLCNSIIYYDTYEKIFRCKKEDCTYRDEKIVISLDSDTYNLD